MPRRGLAGWVGRLWSAGVFSSRAQLGTAGGGVARHAGELPRQRGCTRRGGFTQAEWGEEAGGWF